MTDSISRFLQQELQSLQKQDLLRVQKVFQSEASGKLVPAQLPDLLDFMSNDYLCLAHHPQVIQAASNAAQAYGTSARASQLISGYSPLHQQLCEQLAGFLGEQAALLFPSGFQTNLGVLSALLSNEDAVFCEKRSHACIVDGARNSGARFHVFRSTDLPKLESQLQKTQNARHRWIVTDAIFSMDADFAPLSSLLNLAEQYEATLIVDEAHALGLFGPTGNGLVAELELPTQRIIRTGTLSKAFAAQGGFVVGSQELITLLFSTARTQMFSTGLSPMMVAAASTALQLIKQSGSQRQQLQQNSQWLRERLHKQNITCLGEQRCPIIPVIAGEAETAVRWAKELAEHQLAVAAIRPPTVPHQTSRLRITLNTSHQQTDLENLAIQLERVAQQLTSN